MEHLKEIEKERKTEREGGKEGSMTPGKKLFYVVYQVLFVYKGLIKTSF